MIELDRPQVTAILTPCMLDKYGYVYSPTLRICNSYNLIMTRVVK